MSDAANKIAFQGVPGAYSHMACQAVKPDMEPVACASFEDMLTEVQDGRAGNGLHIWLYGLVCHMRIGPRDALKGDFISCI